MVQTQAKRQAIFSTRSFRWNLPGRVRLGKVIQASLSYNRRTNESKGVKEGDPDYRPDRIRRLARTVGFDNHVSLRNLVAGSIAKPNDEILRAIAPYCYRVARFEIEKGEVVGVVLDYTSTYEDSWEQLAVIGESGEAFDHEIVSPASLSIEMIADLLRQLKDLHKFIPVLEELVESHGKKRQRFWQGQLMALADEGSIALIQDSFRSAIATNGIETPNVLHLDSPELPAISYLFKLVPESVVAIYNGDRLPSVDEIQALVDSGYFLNQDGETYTIRELIDIIDPESSHRTLKNGRLA